MLGAAIGVAIQRRQQAGGVELRQWPRRQDGRAGAGFEIGKQVVIQRKGIARIQGKAAGKGNLGIQRLHRNDQWFVQHLAVRRGQADVDLVGADISGRDWYREACLLQITKGEFSRHIAGADGNTLPPDFQPHFTRRPCGMGDLKQHTRGIPGRKETRQAGGKDHGIAHQNILFRLADTGCGPDHSHQAHSAVEFGHVEGGVGHAVFVHLNGAAEIGDQFFGGWRRLRAHFATGVPAGTDHAHRAVHSVNQTAINIADTHAQFALAEIMFGGIGAFKSCQVQDTDIDGGDGGIGGFTRLHPVHLQRHLHWRARGGFIGHVKGGGQSAIPRIDRRIGQAQRTGGIVTGGHIHRADHGGGDVSTGPPFIGHRQRDQVFTLHHIHHFHINQVVRHHRHQRLARVTGHNAQCGGFAGFIGGFVQRHFQSVRGRGRIGRGIPTGIEIGRGRQIGPVATLHHQFVFAPINRCFDGNGFSVQGSCATGHALAGLDFFPVPVAVLLIPLITGLNPVHGPFYLHWCLGLVFINRDDLERGGRAFGHNIVKQRLDADHRAIGGKALGDAALNRTARAFGNTHGKPRFQRLACCFNIGEGHGDAGKPVDAGAQVGWQGFHRRI